jgi:hypothetical protein
MIKKIHEYLKKKFENLSNKQNVFKKLDQQFYTISVFPYLLIFT